MPIDSSKSSARRLSVPTIRHIRSNSLPNPKLETGISPTLIKASTPTTSKPLPIRVPKSTIQNPPITRSAAKETSLLQKMALCEFITVTDKLSQFESKITTSSDVSLYTHKVRLEQVRSLWEKVETAYERCSNALADESSNPDDRITMQSKYDYCYSVYERCATQLGELVERASSINTTPTQSTVFSPTPRGCNLRPCDTEIFKGDYLKWPTFRDLFTAIYVNNQRLSPVKKLFHLNSKTSGEAYSIVAKFSLTNDGFESAWNALQERFENKRLLVNSQLKILFSLSIVNHESGSALKELQSTIQNCLIALEHSKISTKNWDCLLVYLCLSKLLKLTLSLWKQSLANKVEIPSWVDMNTFLSERYRTLEAIEDVRASASTSSHPKQTKGQSTSTKLNSFESNVNAKVRICDLCSNENHPIRLCRHFLQMKVSEREAYIKQKKLCLNCFARGHQLRDCPSSHNSFTCQGRHNSLLHRSESSTNNPRSNTAINTHVAQTKQSTPTTNEEFQSYLVSQQCEVLLGTAIVNIQHKGIIYPARALIDSGSEGSFISERLFNLIKLPFQSVQAKISGINNVSSPTQKLCHVHISSPTRPRMQIDASAYVLSKLAGRLPSNTIPRSKLRNMPNIHLADPTFSQSEQIDVLLGADVLPSILLSGVKSKICGTLLGQKTVFGWIISSPVPSKPST